MPYLKCENKIIDGGFITGGGVRGVGLDIRWQDGVMKADFDDEGPIQTGALVPDVIEAARQRLQAYQESPLRNRETALAITKLEEALHWLKARQEDREARGVAHTYSE